MSVFFLNLCEMHGMILQQDLGFPGYLRLDGRMGTPLNREVRHLGVHFYYWFFRFFFRVFGFFGILYRVGVVVVKFFVDGTTLTLALR